MRQNLLSILAFTLALLLVFSGCSSTAQVSVLCDTPLYSITMKGDQCYLTPKADLNSASSLLNGCQSLDLPDFSTVDEMRKAIISGDCTEENLYALSRYSENTDGAIEICDLDSLYECTTPSELSMVNVVWYGEYYKYNLSGETVLGALTCCEKDQYAEHMDREYTNYDENYLVTMTDKKHVADRAAVEYYYTTSNDTKTKRVCYTIQDDNKQLIIQEDYTLESIVPSLEISDTVPQFIEFWGTEDSEYFYGILSGFTERPSVEWLSQFGIREYVETSTS